MKTMETIKYRAMVHALNTICTKRKGMKVLVCEKYTQGCNSCDRKEEAFKNYIAIATDQDRIARQEERERCIEAAQAVVCRVHMCGCGVVYRPETCDRAEACGWLKEVQKAIEGGEV